MINVNVTNRQLEELLLDGYVIEHEKNLITIRNLYGKAMAEIIYIEETNEILLNTEGKFIWCASIIDICSCYDGKAILICYIASEDNKHKTSTIIIEI